MQFQYNSDYPGLNNLGQPSVVPEAIARNPLDFPPAQPIPCARITTRVFHPNRNQVATVQNVLVRTMNFAPPMSSTNTLLFPGTATAVDGNADGGSINDSFSSSGMSSSSSSDDDSMNLDDSNFPGAGNTAAFPDEGGPNEIKNAYWIQRTIREAIYGRVLFAVILQRRPRALSAVDGAEWEVTNQHCAVKEMSWQHIRKERERLAEDPIKEVSAMQYIQKWYQQRTFVAAAAILQQQQSLDAMLLLQQQQQLQLQRSSDANVDESFAAMQATNIMMPLDLLSDERNLYSIMPYCDGGELFERLDMNERFSEEEARYWMDQVLNGIENLQHVGICHRDMSLENLLVHQDGALIIDMGMCLMVPFEDNLASTLATSFNQMNMNGAAQVNTTDNLQQQSKPQLQQLNCAPTQQPMIVSGRQRRRCLMRPQGTCGKWIYMSPEIYQNKEPFDGYAVDMWAAGVILFLMLTGFPPWERACQTDERFHYMTAGYLVQMLTEWEIGLSSDAMDLLQRMLFIDPKDRLSLDQVRAHPWMVNGRRAAPIGLSR
ncbi:serine/threonine phosphatase [Nitzschia inconspicua]|uniref:Serine/threonine phosphatase n=1 Tax=Nitzschia inconspicua TaxID=303405 RepID=A0A9K3PLX5_9STRA|nr:serine/threonine phosphatase [Nitzschia inconspicua]